MASADGCFDFEYRADGARNVPCSGLMTRGSLVTGWELLRPNCPGGILAEPRLVVLEFPSRLLLPEFSESDDIVVLEQVVLLDLLKPGCLDLCGEHFLSSAHMVQDPI